MTVRNLTRQTVLATRAVKADNPWTRMRGLLGRGSLPDSEALIIIPCQSVHMLFMRFPIDVVFLDHNGHVTGLCPRLLPYQFSPVFWKSACAIELPVGTIERTNTQPGDHVQIAAA